MSILLVKSGADETFTLIYRNAIQFVEISSL